MKSSPRPWECFLEVQVPCGHCWVFPTPVGVFPFFKTSSSGSSCLPHARGGVSTGDGQSKPGEKSSPRPWGCFVARGGLYGQCGRCGWSGDATGNGGSCSARAKLRFGGEGRTRRFAPAKKSGTPYNLVPMSRRSAMLALGSMTGRILGVALVMMVVTPGPWPASRQSLCTTTPMVMALLR